MRWEATSGDALALYEGLKTGRITWNIKPKQIITTVFPHGNGKYSNVQIRNALKKFYTKIEQERMEDMEGKSHHFDAPGKTWGNGGEVGNFGSGFAKKPSSMKCKYIG
jgi:hypothetical protein